MGENRELWFKFCMDKYIGMLNFWKWIEEGDEFKPTSVEEYMQSCKHNKEGSEGNGK